MNSLTELYGLFGRVFEPHGTVFAGETAPAPQPVESSGVDDTRQPVPSVAFQPVQALLPGLCLAPSAHRISQTAELSALCGAAASLCGTARLCSIASRVTATVLPMSRP